MIMKFIIDGIEKSQLSAKKEKNIYSGFVILKMARNCLHFWTKWISFFFFFHKAQTFYNTPCYNTDLGIHVAPKFLPWNFIVK